MIVHYFHYKKWGTEIESELNKLSFKLLSERPLTIFEGIQFADTEVFIEVISFNFKRIVEVETLDGKRKMCIRIIKNYLSNSIRLNVIGHVK